MKIIKPIAFQPSMLVSTNAVETNPAWAVGTTYAKDALVDYGTHIYISLVNTNVGNQPDISPTQWLLVGPDNIHAMFDEQVNTTTVSPTPLDVVIEPGVVFNSVGILNIQNATSINVTLQDGIGGPFLYSNGFSLDDTIITNWYQYFFEPYEFKTDVVLTDIPPYTTGILSINVEAPSGNVGIGNLVFGNVYDIGTTSLGANIGIRDYSVKQTDDFGNVLFVERPFSKRMDASVFVENNKIRLVSRILADVRAKPCIYIGSDEVNYSPLIVYGFYKDYGIDIAYPSHSIMRIEVEGLI